MSEYKFMWMKGVPQKINFFLQRVWGIKIATDDNLKRMRMNIVSRCWCCEVQKEECISHFFLTAPTVFRLWKKFTIFASIRMDNMNLQQSIMTWCKQKASHKLMQIYRGIPIIFMQTLWKRRNKRGSHSLPLDKDGHLDLSRNCGENEKLYPRFTLSKGCLEFSRDN